MSLFAVDSSALDSLTSPVPEIQVSLPCFSSSPWFKKEVVREVHFFMLYLTGNFKLQLSSVLEYKAYTPCVLVIGDTKQQKKVFLNLLDAYLLADDVCMFMFPDMSLGGGRTNASASASKSKQLKRRKNAPGSRKDPGWDYATDIEGCLSEHKGDLMSMFSSETWRKSTFSTTREGKRIQGIALDSRFWTSVLTCLRAAMPLMKVLRLVDSDELPSMPFLYKPVLNIIEKRWNDQMSRPLHYDAYWLNPKVHFGANFDPNERKLKVGLYDFVERLSKDRDESLTLMQQLDTFHHARGMFSSYGSMKLLDRKHPADWWSYFGDDVPEHQKFAVRILSLTCSASGCERNWSVFERVHSKKRNRLLQKKMNDIVYVMYNSKLLRRQAKDIERVFDEIDSDDEWLAGEDGEVENENENENVEDLMGIDDEATFENESTHEQSFTDKEEEQRFEEEFVADEDEGGDRGNNEEEIGDENAYDEDEGDKEDEEYEELDFNVDPKDLM
ncbi:hypothetical protein LINPERHAP2_LOCUS39570 [Linum perenne]